MEASALSHPVGLGRVTLAGPLLRLRSDDQLLALFRAGHDEAFGTIHERYRQRLLAYARQMLGGSRSDAEDVLQDVFLRAYHALRVDGRPVALRAWLYRVAHNRCIDQLRRPAPAAEDIYDLNRGPQADLTAECERREDLRRLVADVRSLPEQQRSALLMREMEGLSYNELAAALDVTVPAIKSLLVRARIGLVEAGEARDTACREIRTDLASAFDRGVRASGRSRRHLRDCAGCRDYRRGLRRVERQLNGLAPGSGPLGALANLLGLGGAGSGAAAGGGAVAVGAGGAAGLASAGGGVVTTAGTGVVAATATKVAAVVAAAAVVGGSAATVERAQHHQHPSAAPRAVHAAPAPTARAAIATAPRLTARPAPASAPQGARATPRDPVAGATAPEATQLRADDEQIASSGAAAPTADEATTGGVRAPDVDAAPPTFTHEPTPTAPDGTEAADPDGATTGTQTGADGDGSTAPTAGDASSGADGSSSSDAGADAPTGTVAQAPSAPMAQGASVAPPAG